MKDFAEKKPNILLVDDEAFNRKIARKMLEDNYNVYEAASGEEALSFVYDNKPDLILLDVHMPGMSGHDVINRLKKDELTMSIPVVFATADGDRTTEANGLKEGASDFITKPFRRDILLQRIGRIIELDFLQNNLKQEVARQTANAEERSRRIERISLQTIQTLANAIDAKDKYTDGHSTRVSQYAMILAEALGWDNEKVDNLRYAALLHDIGKISIPDTILNNPQKLNESEFDVIKSHTAVGGDILKQNVMIEGAEDVALHHHERYDGKGYPFGLEGEEISLQSRIVAIADAYDAMNSRRVYRKALSPERIRNELIAGKGTQFDPYLVDVFLSLIENGVLEKASGNEIQTTDESMENTSALLQKVMASFVAQSNADEHDVISGLLSRNVGERALAGAMQEDSGCFMFIDVDNLKKINDIMGHNAGDKVLKTMGEAIQAYSEDCISCRLGGDEFLVFYKGANREQAEERINLIIDCFTAKKNLDIEMKVASLSAGLVMCTPEDMYSDIYNKADKALYHVKQNGKEGYFFYTDDTASSVLLEKDFDGIIHGIKASGSYEGAMAVEYRQFAKQFEYVTNLKKRYGYDLCLAVISLNADRFIEELEHAMYCMEEAIKLTIRNVDIVTRYSGTQFLVIFIDPGENSSVEVIKDRIFSEFRKLCSDSVFEPTFDIIEVPDRR